MIKLFLLATELFVGLIQQAAIIQAIVVERNIHTYYRIPVFLMDGHKINTTSETNRTQVYFILQCPYRATIDIPLPKDMQVCVTVGKYEENFNKTINLKEKPKSILHTKVDYILRQKPIRVLKTPFVANIRPMKLNIKFKQPLSNNSSYQKKRKPLNGIASASKIVPQQIKANESVTFGENSKESKTPNESDFSNYTIDDEEPSDDYYSDSNEEQADIDSLSFTPLKFLSVKNAVAKFKNGNLRKFMPPISDQGSDGAEAQAVFAEHTKYRKGHATKGYHNLYHRDESFKDHIFYDDLDQRGKLRHEGRAKQKF